MSKENSAADSLYFEIADAMDLLDNVTADYGSEDSLGQAELALTRAREILVDQGMLCIFAEAPAMVAALRDNLDQFEQMERMFSDDAEFIAALEQTRAILSRIDGAGEALPDAPAPGLWRIVQYDPAGDVTLYWSNANGWGGLARSDGYSQSERETLNLPMGGQWWFDRDDDSELPESAPTGEFVTVRVHHLAALVEAAGKYADDLETGLEDGTYEDRADLDAVQAAIAAVQGEN